MAEPKNELLPVLEQIERDKGVKKEEILKMIETALVSAYRKHSGKALNIEAKIDPETAQVQAFIIKKVVDDVKNPAHEISLEEAKKLKLKAKVDSEVRIPVNTEDFSRIAAQTAKQVIIQKIREIERETLYDEFRQKEGVILGGSVHRFVDRNIIVDLGKVEAILPVREQVRREHFSIGDRVRVLVLKVEKGARGPQVVVSRASPQFLQKLFEMEVPEVYEKTVEIVSVVREPGLRSKVAVKTHNSKVDPVGACVGVKGSRVRPIINELFGERIDLIAWSPDVPKYIGASLSPAKPVSVTIMDSEKKQAFVLVGDDMLSLAIGKQGQNVRLAAKLTVWHIDIKSESQVKEEQKVKTQAGVDALGQLSGVGPKLAEVLLKGGWTDIERLANAAPEDLTVLQGVGEKTALKIIAAAKEFLNKGEVISGDGRKETQEDQTSGQAESQEDGSGQESVVGETQDSQPVEEDQDSGSGSHNTGPASAA